MPVKDLIMRCVGGELRLIFSAISGEFFETVEELRLRAGQPITVRAGGREFFAARDGLCEDAARAAAADARDIRQCVERISGYSMYAFEEDISRGFITLPGGHRAGVAGQVVTDLPLPAGRGALASPSVVKTIKNFSAVNFRIAHEIKGCADTVMPYILRNTDPAEIFSTMIISPPGCGKTTLLRDLIRQISAGGQAVGVADERSEIAGCYDGVPQNDLGPRADVLDACPKSEGMLMLLRSMCPKVIAADELGGKSDALAVEAAANAGVAIICTAHGVSARELYHKPALRTLFKERIFQRFVVLKGRGEVCGIYDGGFKRLMGEEGCQ
ncbi:MAG: stage III sporulation protein AA [Clostridiales bacterium]|nr:stage III sporulation protein AA [Clostridiales bacterium]